MGLVTDLADLDAAAMQRIACKLGYSETIFLDLVAEPRPRVRIFTPVEELPFAGHPLVGCAWFLGSKASRPVGKIACDVGEIPYEIHDDFAAVSVTRSTEIHHASGRAVAARAALPYPTRTWVVNVPQRYILLEVDSERAVSEAEPNFEAMSRTDPIYLYFREGNQVRARFFAPASGVAEDPATGSAAYALASQISWFGEPSGSLTISQGTEIGSPCRMEVEWADDQIRLGGTIRMDGTIDAAD